MYKIYDISRFPGTIDRAGKSFNQKVTAPAFGCHCKLEQSKLYNFKTFLRKLFVTLSFPGFNDSA